MEENSLPIACFVLVMIMVISTASIVVYRMVEGSVISTKVLNDSFFIFRKEKTQNWTRNKTGKIDGIKDFMA